MTGWSSNPEWPSEQPKIYGWDIGKDDITMVAEGTVEDGILKVTDIRKATEEDILKITKVYNNKMPTHDPYTNPNAQVYYECKCGAILDPGTKSFASLNNAASDKGWKVRWKQNGEGYEPFCVECGKDVPE